MIELVLTGSPARAVSYGSGCDGSNAQRPRIDHIGRPFLSRAFSILLRGALPSTSALLSFSFQRENIPLGSFGFTGCTALAFLNASYFVGLPVDAQGTSSTLSAVPPSSLFVGGVLDFQWLVLDLAANPGRVTFSNALEVTIGS